MTMKAPLKTKGESRTTNLSNRTLIAARMGKRHISQTMTALGKANPKMEMGVPVTMRMWGAKTTMRVAKRAVMRFPNRLTSGLNLSTRWSHGS